MKVIIIKNIYLIYLNNVDNNSIANGDYLFNS